MNRYQPQQFEEKWRQKWKKDGLYKTDMSKSGKKFYNLAEWAYPSGDLHIGHWFTFALADILARYKRMQGYNVFFPNGFDAFGLPAENAAIKRGIHPQDWTHANIKRMKEQFDTLGATFDWDHEAISCEPEYYKWNQWIFLKMFEQGLAYRGTLLSNWCPSCQTVLANENIEAGKCWRCGSEVIQKEIEQWFLKITAYADKLLWKQPPQADWPKALREAQNNWIGKSEGLLINFDDLTVFTTRADTLFGVTFLVVSTEHPLLEKFITKQQEDEVGAYVEAARKKSELERKENKEKTGVFTGSFVKNPVTGEQVPVWTADYVLMGYGTGAVMGVPAHDGRDFIFATKYNLPIKQIVEPADPNQPLPYEGEGKLVNSGEYTGTDSIEGRKLISDYIVEHQFGSYETQYHIHDWSISRQRYWGTPIPIIYCDKCGTVPVPEKDLPVTLPYNVDYTPKGKPPLATAEDWVNVKCPRCEGPSKREVETMDTFVDSSWYFFRFLDPHNDQEIFPKDLAKAWMPMDIYFGGPEHTLGHALYSRFFTKFFHDLKLIDFDEYSHKRVHHGIILGTDGARMSKSRGNVVNPDEQVQEYGTDAVRTYLAFIGPMDIVASWNPNSLNGTYHFLERVWELFDKVNKETQPQPQDLKIMHKTIKKVSEEINNIKFNTAVAALMEWLNHLSRREQISGTEYQTFLLLLAPIAPHITEELWSMLGQPYSIHQQPWPEFNPDFLEEEQVLIVVQINGKVRDQLKISRDQINNQEQIEKAAKESIKVQKFLEGKQIIKTIYIPGKILSFVLASA